MTLQPLSLLLAAVGAGAVYLLVATVRLVSQTRRPPGFPPGPPTLPGLGNLHQIPLAKSFFRYGEWARQYGPVLGLKLGTANLVVLHDPAHVQALWDRRGALYNGRPLPVVPTEHVLTRGNPEHHVIFMQNGADLRRYRTALRAHLLNPAALEEMVGLQDAMAGTLLVPRLLAIDGGSRDDVFAAFRLWALGTPFAAITGSLVAAREPGWADRYFAVQHDWLRILEPGATPPVDMLPWLARLPECLAGWKAAARRVRAQMNAVYYDVLEVGRAQGARTAGQPGRFRTFVARMTDAGHGSGGGGGGGGDNGGEKKKKKQGAGADAYDDRQLAFFIGGLLDAALDTSASMGLSMLMCFAAYPRVLTRLQDEVDAVCGTERPPRETDFRQMPYLAACAKEVLRLYPPAPIGLPHKLEKDDTFMGYHFPKDTMFMLNVYSIHRRPEDFDEPDAFRPERFLDNPYGMKVAPSGAGAGAGAAESRRTTYAFGSGRRVCPGDQFAMNNVLVAMAKLVWGFDVVADGPVDVSVETGFDSGLVMSHLPFNVKVVPRDDARRAAMEEDCRRGDETLERMLG